MDAAVTNQHSWARLAGIAGLAAIACYFGAAFLPVPDAVSRNLAFAFGPLLCAAFLGIHRALAGDCDGPVLQVACLFGIVAGAVLTIMLVVQIGNGMVRADLLAAADTDAARQAVDTAWKAVDRVQYLVDVVWDIFICSAMVLLGTSMWSRRGFGRVWGATGILAGVLLLVFNLAAFPLPPASVGSVDLGPVAALWMMAVFIRMLVPMPPRVAAGAG